MNELTLYGRLTRDVDFEISKTGIAVGKTVIAINRGKHEATFIPLKVFGKTCELMTEHVRKGDRILLKAHIQTNVAEVKGQERMYIDIVVDKIQFIENKHK